MDTLEAFERDRPVLEITPAMIEAGARVLRLAGVGAEPCDGGVEAAEDVLLADLEASDAFRSGEWRVVLR